MDGRRRQDVAPAIVFGLAGAAVTLAFPNQPTLLVPLTPAARAVVAVTAAACLLWRRDHPLRSGATIALLTVLSPSYAALASAYAVGAHGLRERPVGLLEPADGRPDQGDRRRPVAVAAVLIALPLSWYLGAGTWRLNSLSDQVAGPGMVVGSALLGLWIGALLRNAGERARGDERTRLAADLHDAVTHRVNLVVLQAGALSSAGQDEGARRAGEEIRRTGVAALAELGEMVGLLHAGRRPDATASPADAGSVAALVGDARSAGMHVRLTESGDPDAVPLPARRALHRVVQEALTNAAKHAQGAEVDVTLEYGVGGETGRSRVTVRSGPGGSGAGATAGAGTGVLGLRRRIDLLGGTLTAGPNGTGFRLRAELPGERSTVAGDPVSP